MDDCGDGKRSGDEGCCGFGSSSGVERSIVLERSGDDGCCGVMAEGAGDIVDAGVTTGVDVMKSPKIFVIFKLSYLQ